MKLITKAIEKKLQANYDAQDGTKDFEPVLKVFNPTGNQTWLISEMDSETGQAFGLCDLGQGYPELGYIDINELKSFRGRFGLGLERDMYFSADMSLTEYAKEARSKGSIAA